jgi:hypothetical protein
VGRAYIGTMNSPVKAGVLNFLLPGFGFFYMGRWMWGTLNFIGVLLVGVLAVLTLSEETFDAYRKFIGLVCSCGSAALANHYAVRWNKEEEQANAGTHCD